MVKVALGLGRGKKLYDKRADEKKRDDDREMQRAVRTR
jgi:SsrA-binding protein